MYSKSRAVILSLAVIGLGLTVGGRGADDGISQRVGTDDPDGSLAAALMSVLAETAGSAVAYAQARNCQIRRGNNRGLGQRRLCINRAPWNFANISDNNFDPVITPDGRFLAFASRDNLDLNPGDADPANPDDPFPGNQELGASRDIFWLDLQTGELRRLSVDELGRLPPPVKTPEAADPAQRCDPTDSSNEDCPQPAEFDSPAISADGRLVAFSTDGVLLDQDRNNSGDVYIKDVTTGRLTLVTAESALRPAIGGVPLDQSGGNENFPVVAMSDNGRFVAFMTTVALDSARDRNNTLDVYVKNLRTKRFFLASIGPDGRAAGVANPPDPNADPPVPPIPTDPAIDISGNGRFVGFTTLAAIDPTDDNREADVYVWDRRRPREAPILVSGGVEPPDGFDVDQGALSSTPALSFNGRFIAFESSAAILDGDNNDVRDIYRYNRVNKTWRRVSLDNENREPVLDGSFDPTISASGRFVAFSSAAGDLLLGDTNFGATDRFENTGFSEDIFVKDLRTRAITRASVDEDGVEPDGTSFSPSLSADGSVIAFVTEDSRLLEPDPGNIRQGDSVVVTEISFQLPLVDIPGDPAGAVTIERNFTVDPGGGILVPEPSSSIPLDFALRNNIEHQDDQDWFRVYLFADRTYTIDLEGRPTRQGSLDDPLLRIFVPKIPGVDLDLADEDDDCGVGLNARLAFQPQAEGIYFISAEGFGAARGTYRLLVREAPDPGCSP